MRLEEGLNVQWKCLRCTGVRHSDYTPSLAAASGIITHVLYSVMFCVNVLVK